MIHTTAEHLRSTAVAVRHCGHTGRMGEFVVQATPEGFKGVP